MGLDSTFAWGMDPLDKHVDDNKKQLLMISFKKPFNSLEAY